MLYSIKFTACIFLLFSIAASLSGCGGCGFECDGNKPNSTQQSLGISVSASDEFKSIQLEIDAITLSRAGADDVVIDKFTIKEENITDQETIQVKLLNYPGASQLLLSETLSLDTGNYTNITLKVIDNDINRSFVKDSNDVSRKLNVANSKLVVGGITVNRLKKTFTININLPQSLQLTANNDYLLTSRGIRIQDNSTAALLSGRVDNTMFDQNTLCAAKTTPTIGNRVYLYKGKNLNINNLADVFSSSSTPPAPANSINPFETVAAARNPQTGGWGYAFGFLPPGDYTLAFSCNAVTDDPNKYDATQIPLPIDQIYTIKLDNAETSICDLKPAATCQ